MLIPGRSAAWWPASTDGGLGAGTAGKRVPPGLRLNLLLGIVRAGYSAGIWQRRRRHSSTWQGPQPGRGEGPGPGNTTVIAGMGRSGAGISSLLGGGRIARPGNGWLGRSWGLPRLWSSACGEHGRGPTAGTLTLLLKASCVIIRRRQIAARCRARDPPFFFLSPGRGPPCRGSARAGGVRQKQEQRVVTAHHSPPSPSARARGPWGPLRRAKGGLAAGPGGPGRASLDPQVGSAAHSRLRCDLA